ncbi:MAG: class I SAM-dependent methyltransferase [Candidatus Hodarchaeota archaeon]
MSAKNEIQIYSKVRVSEISGEIDDYEDSIFQNVIRNREIFLIQNELCVAKPKLILDYGCGGGWLSLLIYNWGFNVIGIDVTAYLLKKAKITCPNVDFIISDAEKLPFKNTIFDFIIGISILHHLDLINSCKELFKVSCKGSKFIFMEPNVLNPLSAIGRKLFPMNTHTKGEKGYYIKNLLKMLSFLGYHIDKYFMLFFLTFPVARFFKIINKKPHISLLKMISLLEKCMEKIPIINHLNSTIIIVGKKFK